MSYRLVYTQKAIRDIARLDAAVKKRLGATLIRFTDNPLQYAERLTNSELGGYRIECAGKNKFQFVQFVNNIPELSY